MCSIPTPPAPLHPRWCAGEPLCSALDATLDPMLRQHAGPTFHIDLPAFRVELQLIQPTPGHPSDVYLIAVAGETLGDPDDRRQAGATLSMSDAWSVLDSASALLEQVR